MIPSEVLSAYCRDCHLSVHAFHQGTFHQLHKVFWRHTFALYHCDGPCVEVDVLINSNTQTPGGGKIVFGLLVYWAVWNQWQVRLSVHRGLDNPRAYGLYRRFGLHPQPRATPREPPRLTGQFAGVSLAEVAAVVTGRARAVESRVTLHSCGS
jgi:hypothetical protein